MVYAGKRGSLVMDIDATTTLMLLDQILPGRHDPSLYHQDPGPVLAVHYLTGPLANSYSVWPHVSASRLRMVVGDEAREIRKRASDYKRGLASFLKTPSRVSILYPSTVDAPDASQGSQDSKRSTMAQEARQAQQELASIQTARDAARTEAARAMEEVIVVRYGVSLNPNPYADH